MSTIRVLVTDDSAFMRKVISDILQSDPEIEVIDRAKNGLECVEKAAKLKPDVITLDIEMPIMNGLEALEQLMKQSPVPVVMLSSLTREGAEATIRALELGAIDFVAKPSGPISLDIHKVGDRLIERVKAASQAKKRTNKFKLHAESTASPFLFAAKATEDIVLAPRQASTEMPVNRAASGSAKLVVLGTSTGGPKALQTVLTALPSQLPAPIAIVQHMPAGFTKSLAQRLDSLCAIRVTEVTDGEWLEPGTAYIAPGGYHFEVVQTNGRLQAKLHQEEPRGGHRPSVDILFESVSRLTKVDKWAIIMTGMGNDGTKGLIKMKEIGPVTSIIEDESTCVVFGMPRAAIQAGLADHVVPLHKIAETLCKLLH
ncbi:MULTISPECIES: protein-glutamate methylesterase/protein-glutamine glutaminase [Brevibacillus]|jgi:two-component system, chemotaxis family, protein-glutamate methylesterase/glutaminase|uniref:Protein-glutamate methylesterase/protein-glutamine glutaminase n=1 Tax=Brevibacillus borstelensis AK1 TaxID=1300222 RepID=M8E4H4_9BACL|nr:chemotaxis response regulator protein-glutamate methylesterase [Brevibacillus borstelensis]EMT54171.1 protein glutamate methylesterase [Brevibacillus borstelensis AK1]MBE5398020.1 chemotaxis response regulator protein-glutamate methylesterase [Brevibacillus borstelensis]MCC0563465.1 chemotaxis response regulator protein-glutamate methylesterase [Brevibacillus borstelensis]MCM3470044.1 chemotaxis response regulator protein-glutamate methylesterase [Brevibacillus borstelensis]MCM3557846.1 che